MNAQVLGFICLSILTCQAQASSSEAWEALDKAVLNSCTQASGLKNPKPVGNTAQFPDQVGYTALLLQGQYPQKHLQGRSGIELCLYNKQTGKAAISEWDSIRPVTKTR
ncbi:hypothetical protein [Pseudomonas sp. Fl4BN1]|uniref:hypothetical protein n=1 Tax=Pseudomonas sp. Fl4BN1 TaxID=2697651 RepID=UPI0013781D48|nr:hypothetical protein [Pseudomonas sp. Fl4BN1]NBF11006.1 hypothetical protein [Pseudomonas sp. Fl4BN1]